MSEKVELVELSKPVNVKNKQAATVQITAEQILREAFERAEALKKPYKPRVVDGEELYEIRYLKRKTYEEGLKKNRTSMGIWLKYAKWEEDQRELVRARSVYERALDVDPRSASVWIRYAEMEMRYKNINHARNIFDRVVAILPRADQFWYKYSYMEEMLGNVAGARQIFERWMEWEPSENAWYAYIKLEKRYKEYDRCRVIYERLIVVHDDPRNWLKYAKFEEELRQFDRARHIYERAIEGYGDERIEPKLFSSFAKFEVRLKELDRARAIYKYGLEKISKDRSEALQRSYSQFEKQYGDQAEIERVTFERRRLKYESSISENPKNYDVWFDYAHLEEEAGEVERVREVYERAIAEVPPTLEKRHWRRYVYLWIRYAIYEEMVTNDYDRCDQVYKACLQIIPHKQFTFSKVWFLYAKFKIRRFDLLAARKILGNSIGQCPKNKSFKNYIELEMQLREFDRCRIIYQKYLEWDPFSSNAWIKFAELETMLGDTDRARAIFELAISQSTLDVPEVVWKAYIDFEEDDIDNCRSLYERLLLRTEHVKVWISFANFEASVPGHQKEKVVAIFERAYASLKGEERVILLEAWKEYEESNGTEESVNAVLGKFPRKVKKRRKIITDDGLDAGWEEYYHYIFPEDQPDMPHLKLLAMAHKWKKEQQAKK